MPPINTIRELDAPYDGRIGGTHPKMVEPTLTDALPRSRIGLNVYVLSA